jgi:hypothetical protein
MGRGVVFSAPINFLRAAKMSHEIPLHEVPGKLLDQEKWKEILDLTSSETEALCSLNAPYPDSAEDFFWKGTGSNPDARRCYRLGKSLLEDCRSLFISGALIATGETINGTKREIPAGWWSSLYPMFFTDKVRGRSREFRNVVVREGEPTLFDSAFTECIAWLSHRKSAGESAKKVLQWQARESFPKLTDRSFDIAYKTVFKRKRGRPSKLLKTK